MNARHVMFHVYPALYIIRYINFNAQSHNLSCVPSIRIASHQLFSLLLNAEYRVE